MVAAARIFALVLLVLVCVPPHLASKLLFRRSGWPPRFLGAAGWICGARVRVTGRPVKPGTLLICNHVSWLDILVLGGATGCAFVSKDELGHPIVHWLADQNHTLYIRREHRKSAADQAEAIARRLEGPQPLALFPEGTTGPGTHLLPFLSTLFSAVAPPPDGATVRPVAIDYGEAAADIGWHDEPGKENVPRVLGRTRPLPVTIRLLDPLPRLDDRKAISNAAREAIDDALTSSRAPAAL